LNSPAWEPRRNLRRSRNAVLARRTLAGISFGRDSTLPNNARSFLAAPTTEHLFRSPADHCMRLLYFPEKVSEPLVAGFSRV
jgi:hypothetical protein